MCEREVNGGEAVQDEEAEDCNNPQNIKHRDKHRDQSNLFYTNLYSIFLHSMLWSSFYSTPLWPGLSNSV